MSGGKLFENAIARRIVILSRFDASAECERLKILTQEKILRRHNLQLWLVRLEIFVGYSCIVVAWSLAPFLVGFFISVSLSVLGSMFLLSPEFHMFDYLTSCLHRVICSISRILPHLMDLANEHFSPGWYLFAYWKWVCYILIGEDSCL